MEELLIVILIILFMLTASVSRGGQRHVVAVLGTLIIVILILTLAISGRLIDDRFWFHFNIRDILIGSEFIGWKRWLILPAFIMIYFGFYLGSIRLASFKWFSKPKRQIVISIIVGVLLLFGIFQFDHSYFRFQDRTEKSIDESLVAVGYPSNQYIYPDNVRATPGKNVVVIYLESIEKAYFHKELVHLVPNLKKLKDSWSFIPMRQGIASDWTAAAFYTSIYGVPAFFSLGSSGNSIFQNTKQINLTGIGHVYEAAEYERVFILGNKEFAGLEDLLTASGFSVKSEVDFETKYDPVPWGLHDIDLFVELKKEIRNLSASKKQFALHVATSGSHGPNGFYDPRIEPMISVKTQNKLHNMVSATDFLVGDFISFMEKEGYLENTIVYIMPDHLLMGRASEIEKLDEERLLFLLSNAKIMHSDTLSQIELPGLMLEGAEIAHNAIFLSDYIPANKVNGYLKNNKNAFQELNERAVAVENLASGFKVQRQGQYVKITTPLFEKEYAIEKIGNQVLCINLDHKFRIQKSRVQSLYAAFHEIDITFTPRLVIDIKDEMLYGAIIYGNKKVVTKRGANEIGFTQDDIQLLREWPYSKEFYNLPKTPVYHSPDNSLYVTSSILGDPQILTPSQIIINGRIYPIKKAGLHLVEAGGVIKYFNPKIERDIQQLKNILSESKDFKCLLVHGSGRGPFNKILVDAGLVKLSNLGTDIAYVAYPYKGFISEHTSASTVSLTLDSVEQNFYTPEQIRLWAQDRSRFIAHAGGSIDGIRYTNCLEALNRSYENGFRYFELDILQTTDGQFVATHDWGTWHNLTGSPGRGPVDHEEFLARTILQNYTPMDIDRINLWFANHPDAILVSDKVNDPEAFSKAFQFPDRLIMELFTIDALKIAADVKVKYIASQQVVQKLGSNKLELLQKLNIEKVALSRQFFVKNKNLCTSFSDNGIQIYLYNLNDADQRNEIIVFHHDLPIAYGMYAEDWSF